ncbi:MAG: ABC transporter ATP-binding protein [Acidimicrobiia bacterium]|nr:ABC transporter ATP-binding protein [Acidimicrobiia bacterium]
MQPNSTPGQTGMIVLDHVSKVFDGALEPAVDRLSLSVEEGEIVVLVGPSGCGKTTTLRMINRLVEPTSGEITVAGRRIAEVPVHELRRTIGYVIQQIGLFPHRTIAQNIATVPNLLGWDRSSIRARVDELADLVALDRSMLDRYPRELSGGQRQRVGVARALAADPPVLLMDEPFGAVDPIVRHRLQTELRALQDRVRKTIVLVTHDIDEAIGLGDRVAILNTGGVLEQYAAPDELLATPTNPFVASFLGTDRGIKRLSLMPIRTDDLAPGPTVEPGSLGQHTRGVMAEFGVDWVFVVDDGRLVGWVDHRDVDDSGFDRTVIRTVEAAVDISATLKEGLDAIITSHTPYAAVCDGDRFLGVLTASAVSNRINGST